MSAFIDEQWREIDERIVQAFDEQRVLQLIRDGHTLERAEQYIAAERVAMDAIRFGLTAIPAGDA